MIDEMGEALVPTSPSGARSSSTRSRRKERFWQDARPARLALLDEEVANAKRAKQSRLAGDVVFKLYDTFGFPTDLTEDILRGHGLSYDRAAFDDAMRAQAERARAAWKGSGEAAPAEVYGALASAKPVAFTGYDALRGRAQIRALIRGGESVREVGEGDRVELVVDETPFYAEAAGRSATSARSPDPTASSRSRTSRSPVEGLIVHRAGSRWAGSRWATRRAVGRRRRPRRRRPQPPARTSCSGRCATCCWAAGRAGENRLVAPDRLRFDFTHDAPLGRGVRAVEDRVNALDPPERVPARSSRSPTATRSPPVRSRCSPRKYGDRVRVVSFGPSTELCGGTYAHATGDIGSLRIVGQAAIGAGVRRLEAATGFGALEHARRDARALRDAADLLKSSPAELAARVARLLEHERELERELEKTRAQMRRGGSSDPMQQVREVGGVKLLASEVEDASPKELRGLVDELKQRLGSGIVLLGVRHDGKAALALGVTKDLVGRFSAGDLIRELAKDVGGTGGGRPDFAQAGGPDTDKLPQALERLASVAGLKG